MLNNGPQWKENVMANYESHGTVFCHMKPMSFSFGAGDECEWTRLKVLSLSSNSFLVFLKALPAEK